MNDVKVPSDAFNLSEIEVNGKTAIVSKEDQQYTILWRDELLLSSLFMKDVPYLAGLAVGYWKSKEDVVKNWAIDRTFTPEMGDIQRDQKLTGWHRAAKCAFGWARDDR